MCYGTRLVLFSIVLATMLTINAAGQFKKPAAEPPTPSVTAADVTAIRGEINAVKTAIGDMNLPRDNTVALARMEGKVDQLIARPTPAPDKYGPTFYLVLALVVLFVVTRIGHAIRERSLGALFALVLVFAVIVVPAANAAVTLDKVAPDKFTVGTSGPIEICTKAAIEDLRIFGSGVTLGTPTLTGQCFSATLKVDATATVGRRAVEVKETPTGGYTPTGFEIEIIAAPPTPPAPLAPPTPSTPPSEARLRQLEGRVNALQLTLEGVCAGDAGWKKAAFGSKRGTSVLAGADCRNAIISAAVADTLADPRLKDVVSAGVTGGIDAYFIAHPPAVGPVGVTEARVGEIVDGKIGPLAAGVQAAQSTADEAGIRAGRALTLGHANAATTAAMLHVGAAGKKLPKATAAQWEKQIESACVAAGVSCNPPAPPERAAKRRRNQ